jgi:hypothetical protein
VHVSVGYPGRLADDYGVVPATSLRDGLALLLQDDGQAVHIPAQQVAGVAAGSNALTAPSRR